MSSYGFWKEQLEIEGELFPADSVDPYYCKKAVFERIYAVRGLPFRFERDLIRASQVSDAPHTWRVKESKTENDVTDETIALGKIALDKDRAQMGVHIITYIGFETATSEPQFLAAGAVRNKLTRDYENASYPLVSRAIVAPAHRGKGLGSLIVEHRMQIVLEGFFGKIPNAIHFGTENKKILHFIKKVETKAKIKFVYIGDEQYTAADGTHTVHDFLCYLPHYGQMLIDACDILRGVANSELLVLDFKEKLRVFMSKGVGGVLGAELESSFMKIKNSLGNSSLIEPHNTAFRQLEEVFFVRDKIGAKDPATVLQS